MPTKRLNDTLKKIPLTINMQILTLDSLDNLPKYDFKAILIQLKTN